MKIVIIALLISLTATSALADDLATMRTRVAHVIFAKNYCAANVKWIYSTTASLKLAEAEHSNWLSVNYAMMTRLMEVTDGITFADRDKACDDSIAYLRSEDALLKPERGD
jgi:hypothetical protein